MRYLLVLLLTFSSSALGISARVYDTSKQIADLGIEIKTSYPSKMECRNLEIKIRPYHSFFQGEHSESSGEEGFVRMEIENIYYVKYVGHVENGYTLLKNGARIPILSRIENGLFVASMCIHKEDLKHSYLLLNYVLEKHPSALIYIPVESIEHTKGEKHN